ncbi:type VI secretion protein IcmF/TssM N-terminal domain-containing protein [Pseudomonas sp. nanlin1]|uniref:type VI secretion protein IcmF/TssM N-terminal domain-containing protein n=1 Tax=Pseudomonas sp. nanlin1 TaxID=3040605 RepID=UPI00388D9290
MKTLLRTSRSFWFIVSVLCALSLLLCWFIAQRLAWSREYVLQAMALISAMYLLLIVMRQYQCVRAEHNIENLLQRENNRSLKRTGEFCDHQVLRERLKLAIATLSADRAAGGGSIPAPSTLPWYLVMGMSASGKTSLLTRSGLFANIASDSTVSNSGTQHCDWYFSPDAVLIDTAARYLHDDQSAREFAQFLQLLKKQRKKSPINGLVLVVSLPELLEAGVEKRAELATNLATRLHEYADSLGSNPPIYLMLSKTDQLPGFEQAFENLDPDARKQPWGMTFGLPELAQQDLGAILESKLKTLYGRLCNHVDAEITSRSEGAASALLNFPRYFEGLSQVLGQFLSHFSQASRGAPLLLRGVYFTSAVQTGEQLKSVYDEIMAESFALKPGLESTEGQPCGQKRAERSYFITDTFRRIIFPDRDLSLYQAQSSGQPVTPALIALTLLLGLSLLGWQALSFQGNRHWVALLQQQLKDFQHSPEHSQPLASGEGLDLLGEQLARIDEHRVQGVPLGLSAGLYRGADIYQITRTAYLQRLRVQVLEPVNKDLQLQLRAFNDFAQSMEQQRSNPAPRTPAQASDAAELSAATGSLSLSEEMLGRLDEHQVASIIEAYNALKLYLVLTEPKIHPDSEFVSMALPAAWARTASAASATDAQIIDNHTPMYVQLLKAGHAPSLSRNEQLISQTRESLKSFMVSSSLVDREYLRLQLESSRQFPPLSLSDLVPLPGRQLLYGTEAVPAIYTRQGWEQFVKPELIKLVSSDLQNESDWVLDGDGGDSIVQKSIFMREFMSRYKRDYAQAWYTLVDRVGVRDFTDMGNAAQKLSLLSDVQNSPVKLLLMQVNEQTSWDLPAPRDTQALGDKLADNFWSKVTGVLDHKSRNAAQVVSPLPPVDDGTLAKRFEPVARIFAQQNADGGNGTVMDRYLAALRKLKVRIHNIQRSQDIGKSSKQLISETLEGQPSEVADVRNYVETSVDISQGGISASLQKLFSLPIQFAWNTLRAPAGKQISQAWAQQVARPWERVMAHRFPFTANSRNEASVKDLQRFVDPELGLLPNFKRNEIGNLSGGEGLGMGGSGRQAALVDTRMLNSIDHASALGQVIASLSDRENGFEIMLEPAPNLTDIIFTLDGQVQHYRNGRTSWERFSWPGTTTAPGARMDVITLSGERVTVFDFPGRWGLLKMSDSARVADLDGIQQRLSWNAKTGRVSLLVRNYGGVKLTDLANVKALNALNDSGGRYNR